MVLFDEADVAFADEPGFLPRVLPTRGEENVAVHISQFQHFRIYSAQFSIILDHMVPILYFERNFSIEFWFNPAIT